jgi:hypothetical protein
MSLFLYSFIDNFENIFLPNDVVMIRNYEEEKEWIKETWRCTRAAKATKPSWSPNPSRARVQFRL